MARTHGSFGSIIPRLAGRKAAVCITVVFTCCWSSSSAQAQCNAPENGTFTEYFIDAGEAANATIGIDDDGNYVVVYQILAQDSQDPPKAIYARRGCPDGPPISGRWPLSLQHTNLAGYQLHLNPTLAMSRDGHVHVVWRSKCEDGCTLEGIGIKGDILLFQIM